MCRVAKYVATLGKSTLYLYVLYALSYIIYALLHLFNTYLYVLIWGFDTFRHNPRYVLLFWCGRGVGLGNTGKRGSRRERGGVSTGRKESRRERGGSKKIWITPPFNYINNCGLFAVLSPDCSPRPPHGIPICLMHISKD
jgi:hypothetical protein